MYKNVLLNKKSQIDYWSPMTEKQHIGINLFQLAVLLDVDEKLFYNFVINHSVYCVKCRGIASKGIEVEEIYLTERNDIRVQGRCRICNGSVGRLFAFGEKKEFDEKAYRLRKSIGPPQLHAQ
ncbi:MAG: hypothetical protein LLF80_11035 [Porphyromonadaceae bacterium]|nr:hypothetical protein [Porphyromonadaceae bacterium]